MRVWKRLESIDWKWRHLIIAGVVLLAVGGYIAGEDSDDFDGYFDEHYAEWRADCQARATIEVYGSIYTVGGNHWVDLVNDCITDMAVDQSP